MNAAKAKELINKDKYVDKCKELILKDIENAIEEGNSFVELRHLSCKIDKNTSEITTIKTYGDWARKEIKLKDCNIIDCSEEIFAWLKDLDFVLDADYICW